MMNLKVAKKANKKKIFIQQMVVILISTQWTKSPFLSWWALSKAQNHFLQSRTWTHVCACTKHTSSLYQKVKFPYKKFVVNNPWRQPSYKCQRASPCGPSQKWGFNTLWIWVWWGSFPQFFRGRVEYFLMPVTMKNTNDFSGMGIWKKKHGIHEFPDLPMATPPLGLGYKPTEEGLLMQ